MHIETMSMLSEVWLLAGILLFCAFVQSTVGFAFSLFSNALLLLAGVPLAEAVMLSFLGSALQRLLMTVRLRQHIAWRQVLPMSGICLVTLPLGIYILSLCSRQSVEFAKVCLAGLILAVLLVQWLWKTKPHQALSWFWGVLAAASSGILTGLANIGGPPLLLWVHAHNWPNQKTRATIPAITLLLVPVQLLLMLQTFGRTVLPSPLLAMLLVPAILIGTGIGLIVGYRLSRPRLRRVALVLLLITCLAGVIDPIIGRL